MKLQRTFLSSLIVFCVASAPNIGNAEDIDIYLKSPSIERDDAANVLIIFDNSGSMVSNNITSTAAYDPSTVYVFSGTGTAFDVTKIYWKKSSQSAIPSAHDTYPNQFFAFANNRCAASGLPWHLSTIDVPSGLPTGDANGFSSLKAAMSVGGAKWTGMTAADGVVDCKPDHNDDIADQEGTGLKWLKKNDADKYTDTKGQKFKWGGTNVTLYSGNYLNYKSSTTTVVETRLQVAQRVVKKIFDTNPGVRFGLMLFNKNNIDPGDLPDGGYIAMRIGRLSEDITYQGFPTTRLDALKVDIIDTIDPNSGGVTTFTPLAETMYEAMLYFSGGTPKFGYPTPNPVPFPDPIARDPIGTGDYKSPFAFECQKAFIIYITDGSPTHDDAADILIDGLPSIGPLNPPYSGGLSSRLDELAGWMATQDLIPDNIRANKQQVITYTIGFDLGNADAIELLTDTATKSGGQYFPATNADELQTSIQAVLTDVIQTNTSFVAPSLSVNAFNRLFNRDEVYFALFKPSATVAWDGNVKKFKLKADQTTTDSQGNDCTFGDVVDKNGVCAVDPQTLRVKDTAESFWGSVADGGVVTEGGAGAQIPAAGTRDVYTYLGAYAPVAALDNPLKIAASAGNALYDAAILDPTILGLGDTSAVPVATTTNAADTAAVTELINWMLGQDSYDKDQDASTTDARWAHGDPLHSRPVAITYGGTTATPIIKLFYAGNDGAIHMVNDANGTEEWAFYPQETLNQQFNLSQDPAGGKIHSVDGTPSFRVHDIDGDGVIEPAAGEFIHMFINTRRGGKNIYAFNVTPAAIMTVPTATNDVNPKLMWVIRGGVDLDYLKLAQTWSKVLVTDIRFGNATVGDSDAKTVLILAGGFDANEDDVIPIQEAVPATVKTGNAIYIVDPDTGARLWWASDGADSGGNTPTLALPKMKFSIPSDLALMDANGDGETDRIYVGDTGGQLWRIDLGDTLKLNDPGGSVGYVFADVGCEGGTISTDRPNCGPSITTDSNRRKFFYPPDVAQVIDTNFVLTPADSRYDLVAIASGDREDPLDLLTPPGGAAPPFLDPVRNRIYAFRDVNVDSLQGQTTPATPLVDADLYDATDNKLQDQTDTAVYNQALDDIKNAKGWFIDLKEIGVTKPAGSPSTWPWVGEKGLSRVLIFDGKILVTTYVPANQQTAVATCDPNEGLGRFYGLNYLNATAGYDLNKDGNYTSADRSYSVGGGIPSDPVIVIREGGTTGLVGTSGGAAKPPIDGKLPRFKTFWFQK